MRVNEKHVGKIVREPGWRENTGGMVTAVGKHKFLATTSVDGTEKEFYNGDDWQLVEEPKKPSDRVKELFEQFAPGAPYRLVAFEMALLKYLDEQAEKAPR